VKERALREHVITFAMWELISSMTR